MNTVSLHKVLRKFRTYGMVTLGPKVCQLSQEGETPPPFLPFPTLQSLFCTQMVHFSSGLRSIGVSVGEGRLRQVWEVSWVQNST